MPLLFSYGTLQQKQVQLANFGRELTGFKDALPNYLVGEIKITDERVIKESGKEIHLILKYTGTVDDEVSGSVFELSEKELDQADDYEVDDYQRVRGTLTSGRTCWIYAVANDTVTNNQY